MSYAQHPDKTMVGSPLELAWLDYGCCACVPAANLTPDIADAAVRKYKELYEGAVPPIAHHLEQEYRPLYKHIYFLGPSSKGPYMWAY